MANVTYYIYDKITGVGQGIESRPKNDCNIQLSPTQEKTLKKFDAKIELFQNGKVVGKKDPIVKMSQDAKGVLLENLENPTRITITGNGTTFHRVITDGAYQFSIDTPGDYVVKCESDVELPIEFMVTIPK